MLEVNEISDKVFNKLLKKASTLIVDVREKEEFINFNIGGLNVPGHLLNEYLEQLKAFKSLIVVCSNGSRSHIMARVIQKKIPTAKVYHLSAGIIK